MPHISFLNVKNKEERGRMHDGLHDYVKERMLVLAEEEQHRASASDGLTAGLLSSQPPTSIARQTIGSTPPSSPSRPASPGSVLPPIPDEEQQRRASAGDELIAGLLSAQRPSVNPHQKAIGSTPPVSLSKQALPDRNRAAVVPAATSSADSADSANQSRLFTEIPEP
jgi:hypothetical protein